MTGKTQLEVLEYLESAGEVSSQTVALVLNLERHRATQVLLGLAQSGSVVRLREYGAGSAKTIIWRLASDEEILSPMTGKPEFPAGWARVDHVVRDCINAMVRVS
jgi:hypothetical protein